jgi:error-prone DNA polymerase
MQAFTMPPGTAAFTPADCAMSYAELHASSAFSFLRGASLPESLAHTAAELNIPAVALCDRNGLYGMPRFKMKAEELKLASIVGCELGMDDGTVLPVLVENRRGYENLCSLLSEAHLRSPKGESVIHWNELPAHSEGLIALTGGIEGPLVQQLHRRTGSAEASTASNIIAFPNAASSIAHLSSANETVEKLIRCFGPNHVFVEVQRHRRRGEERTIRQLLSLAGHHRLPVVATNAPLFATPDARQIADVFTCLRNHTHLDLAGSFLSLNSERHLKSAQQMGELFSDIPGAIANTMRVAERCSFRLQDLGYEFPEYPTPDGSSQEAFLRRVTIEGAHRRYPSGIPGKVKRQIVRELDLINRLGFAGYFLIVWDIVNFCRQINVMVQGRGSAANSAVCFCLHITAVDAVKYELLFERFLSEGRKSWPDIDLDLPSGDRRESVIQEVYERYSRRGAAMTANVITYRGRSAAREVGKVLNFPTDIIDRFSALFAHGDYPHTLELADQMRDAGIPVDHPRTAHFMRLYQQIYGLPRHLGQHSGGMILCPGKLSSIVPLENASMPKRSVAQWDKDDCEDLGIIKVDLLGLGMMAVLQDAVELCAERGHPADLAEIPKDDPATYDLICKADTIGTFQVESRAQMATLPRMRPVTFYDLAIEVAIIRPGPIQGGLMHPYLQRRQGLEKVTYIDPRLEPALKRTLGVPLFQEQILQIAMIMADFTGSEGEELRRAVSFHRSQERMNKIVVKLRSRMEAKKTPPAAIEEIIRAISSFALYGFPESHAISFALLAYASCWLKVHRGPEFYACLLNNQPMGFYSSATLIRDAKRRGIRVRPVCIKRSSWRCTVERDNSIRLGFTVVRGLSKSRGEAMIKERDRQPFASIPDLKRRVPLNRDELRILAELGALNALTSHRRTAQWEAEEQLLPEDDLFAAGSKGSVSPLTPMNDFDRLQADYRGTELTTGPHPMALVRERFPDLWRAADLEGIENGLRIRIGGAVICRQRPGTASGFVFISLEDETGVSNAIVEPWLFERDRLTIVHEPFLMIEGRAQNVRGVIHIRAERIEALILRELSTAESHDFH